MGKEMNEKGDIEEKRVSRFVRISFIISLLTILSCPFYYAAWKDWCFCDSLLISGIIFFFTLFLAAVIMGYVARRKTRKLKDQDGNAPFKTMTRYSIEIPLLFGFFFLLFLFALPTGEGNQRLLRSREEFSKIKLIGNEVEEYISKENRYPDNLKILQDSSIDLTKYKYFIKEENSKRYFVIEFTRPQNLFYKDDKKIISCLRPCKRVVYIQKKGLIISQ